MSESTVPQPTPSDPTTPVVPTNLLNNCQLPPHYPPYYPYPYPPPPSSVPQTYITPPYVPQVPAPPTPTEQRNTRSRGRPRGSRGNSRRARGTISLGSSVTRSIPRATNSSPELNTSASSDLSSPDSIDDSQDSLDLFSDSSSQHHRIRHSLPSGPTPTITRREYRFSFREESQDFLNSVNEANAFLEVILLLFIKIVN
jgi:hypothetical protein